MRSPKRCSTTHNPRSRIHYPWTKQTPKHKTVANHSGNFQQDTLAGVAASILHLYSPLPLFSTLVSTMHNFLHSTYPVSRFGLRSLSRFTRQSTRHVLLTWPPETRPVAPAAAQICRSCRSASRSPTICQPHAYCPASFSSSSTRTLKRIIPHRN